MKKRLSALIFFISIISIISFSATYSVRPVTVSTNAGNKATVYATVTSDMNDTFLIMPIRWSSWVFPSKYYIQINEGETKKIPIDIVPFESINPGTYTVMINGYSVDKDEMFNGPVIVTVEKPYSVKFGKMYITGKFVPLGNATIKTTISNIGTKTISNLVIEKYIYKNNDLLNKSSETISINPGNEKDISFTINIPEGDHGSYEIYLIAKRDEVMDKVSNSFNIENVAILKESKRPLNIIFTKGEVIKVTNLGNVDKTYTYKIKVSNFDKNSLSTNGALNGNEIDWSVDVKPGETKEIYYKVSYLPYLLLIVVLIFAGWLAFFKSKSLKIHKKIVKKDGSISILIEIENSTGKELKSVVIEDSVIPIFKILPHEYGPLFKVKKKKDRFVISWNIPSLHPGEQRILSYDIHEVIGVNGNIEFGPAKITYKVNGRGYKVFSNPGSVEMGNKLDVAEK